MSDSRQTITPWEAEAKRPENGQMVTIDYDHLIKQFGCQRFDQLCLSRFAAHGTPHRLLRRGLVFAHRDLESVLSCIEKGEKFFLYTGRGPSSSGMHVGHSIPFLLCRYLQQMFRVPLVIQITDDEKFLCKSISLEQAREYARENIKDIIAYGFDPELTYIFSNYESRHLFYENVLKISKRISLNEACKVFGFDSNTNIGIIEFPAAQIAASFPTSFPFIPKGTKCLIPCGVDQDPYFRLARDLADGLGEPKPATIYATLLPSLLGTHCKMSASDRSGAIYLDDAMDLIKQKITRTAFSGGQETMELHRKLGGNVDVDVPYQYLRYFMEDDEELERLRAGYVSGTVGSGEMKKKCIEVMQAFVKEYQKRRNGVTDEVVKRFMSPL